jgi:hypothetical protein
LSTNNEQKVHHELKVHVAEQVHYQAELQSCGWSAVIVFLRLLMRFRFCAIFHSMYPPFIVETAFSRIPAGCRSGTFPVLTAAFFSVPKGFFRFITEAVPFYRRLQYQCAAGPRQFQ